MPQWIKFSTAYDHPGETIESLTAYPAGAVLYLADDIADAAIACGAAEVTDKPEDGSFVPPPQDADTDTTADLGRDGGVAASDSADAHRGDVRIELRDATAGER